MPAEEGFDSLDTTLLRVASDGLRLVVTFSVEGLRDVTFSADGFREAIFSVDGARRSSNFGNPVGVTARLLAAEFVDRLVVGVTDRVVFLDRPGKANVAARDSLMGGPAEGDLTRAEGGVLSLVDGGVTGPAKVFDRGRAVGVTALRVVVGMPGWAVGVAGRRMGSLDLEVEEAGFTTVAAPARFVDEPLVYVSPVDLRSSSFGFPSMDMLADRPLVWIDGRVTVVDGGYLLVTADFSFLAVTSFVVASVIALARRPGIGPPVGG